MAGSKFNDLPRREQEIEKSHTAELNDELKRLFEARVMTVTGPDRPTLDID